MKKNLMSAKFKKDYVAYLAIVIFFFIVTAEMFMAIGIPLHLRSENVWAEQVSRQEMIDSFDGIRNGFSRFRSKNDRAEEEAKIAGKCLNALADYLRRYQKVMSQDQIQEVETDLFEFKIILEKLSSDQVYSKNLNIDPTEFLAKLNSESTGAATSTPAEKK
ncbi:MAG: hypothetical protein WC071_09595 [Victivallaceae bacterium]